MCRHRPSSDKARAARSAALSPSCAKHWRVVLGALAAASGCGLGLAAQAQSLVVRSTGPSAGQFPIGKVLAANASVTLGDSDRLMVLDQGGSRMLMGPGSFVLDGKVMHDREALVRMRTMLAFDAPRPIRMSGGVRGGSAAAGNSFAKGPPGLWFVDLSKGGSYCAVNGTRPALWRPDTERLETWNAALARDGATAPVVFKPGDPVAPWPDDLVIIDGGSYKFHRSRAQVSVTIHALSSGGSDPVAYARQLAAKGCLAQLNILADAAIGPSRALAEATDRPARPR